MKLLSLEAAVGSVGATPPGPPSLPSWGLMFPKARKLPRSIPLAAGQSHKKKKKKFERQQLPTSSSNIKAFICSLTARIAGCRGDVHLLWNPNA